VLSESSCALRLARHSQNAWARHVERVESSQVEFGLMSQNRPSWMLTDLRNFTGNFGVWKSVDQLFSV